MLTVSMFITYFVTFYNNWGYVHIHPITRGRAMQVGFYVSLYEEHGYHQLRTNVPYTEPLYLYKW